MKKLVASLMTLCALFASVSDAAAQEKVPSESQFSDSLSKLEKNVVKFTLGNGLRVLIYQRSQIPIFTGQAWVKVGGVDEAIGTTGVAHMLEHMAFKGTATVGTNDYEREKELLAKLEGLFGPDGNPLPTKLAEYQRVVEELKQVWVDDEYAKLYVTRGGISLNAGTAKDFTFYVVSLPSTAFEFWCWMESERLFNPVFRQFYQEREVVQEERRSRFEDDPEGLLYENLLSTAFVSHPYQTPTIGWPSDLKRLRTAHIDDFYRKYYRPDNMALVLVGDIDPVSAKPILERYFGRFPAAKGAIPEVTTVEMPQRGERQVLVEYDAAPHLLMAYHKPAYPHPDDAYFTILHELLSGGRSSIFQRALVQEKQLATSISTTEAPGSRYPSVFMVSATPNPGVDYERLRREIEVVFAQIKEHGVSDAALEAAKRRIKVGLVDGMASNAGLAFRLGNTEILYGDWKKLFDFYDEVLATTNEDIKNIVTKYLTAHNLTIAKLVAANNRSAK